MYRLKEPEAEELNLIAIALGDLPFKSVAPLVAQLRRRWRPLRRRMPALRLL